MSKHQFLHIQLVLLASRTAHRAKGFVLKQQLRHLKKSLKTFSGLQLEPDVRSISICQPGAVKVFFGVFFNLKRGLHLLNRDTNLTNTAGSALDYLEDFGNSFISISDNQSSYPAHSLTMQVFHSTGMLLFIFFFKQP